METVNPNGAAIKPDFSRAHRFTKRNDAYNGEVYATDADGMQYRFESVEIAAQNIIDNGYYSRCSDPKSSIKWARAYIRKSICANKMKQHKNSRFAGFEWRDHLTIH